MARACVLCGKKASTGNRIVRHGLEKRKGGIGLHTTAVTRRRFLPNVQKVRMVEPESGAIRRASVCAACIKAGKVKKP